MSFATPAWLLGLLLVPVIWYLHRSGPVLRIHMVESLDPWRDSSASANRAGERRRPDPAWIRRAAIAALLSLALAGPTLPRAVVPVTLWVDDSLSMLTEESGSSRLQRGLAQVAAALRVAGVTDFEVRALSRPWRALRGTEASNLDLRVNPASAGEPHPPDARHLDRSRAHWLLTDGADASVDTWLAAAPIARVFQVGEAARNAGISGLSVRTQPSRTGIAAIQVQVTNGGAVRESRRVEVATVAGPAGSTDVSIEPGATATISFEGAVDGGAVTARLSPADALHADDTVSVATAVLQPVPVAVDPSCPSTVARAVRAHPALRESGTSDAGLAIQCSATTGTHDGTPRVWLHDGAISTLDASTLSWPSAIDGTAPAVPMELARRARGRIEPPGAHDVVLLESEGRPLIVLRPGPPRVVETALDFSSPAAGAEASVPLVIGLLADLALDQRLLDRTVQAGRGSAASLMAPIAQLQAGDADRPLLRTGDSTIERPLLLLAMLLLAWDAALLARRLLRDNRRSAQAQA
jgi:Aerotolerance regulator N-terminal